jgi:mono/diheme cytochrome c family protein
MNLHSIRHSLGRFSPVTLGGGAMLAALVLVILASGCRKEDMADQARYDPLEHSDFFSDGKSARPLVEGTVPRGHHPVEDALFAVSSGSVNAPEATHFPFPLKREDLEVGQQQFNIYCSVCHGRLADGHGMIVQRGFPQPPALTMLKDRGPTEREQRILNSPPGHIFNVISFGYGAMYSYGDRIAPENRWRIIGYIKALQASAAAEVQKQQQTPAAAGTMQPR